MFGSHASPIGPIKTKRFSAKTLPIIDDLPEIDLMLMTHDHYDHLDYDSIMKLKSKVKHAFVSLGVKRHLVSWGMEEHLIEEFDWWDQKLFHDINITITPTRHFSGRGINSLAKCLWGGWAFKTQHENIWFSGEGRYGKHFKEIGKRLGPFDIGFMECGQYSVDWPQIHMFPNESAKAAKDAHVQTAMPFHWAGFNLSYAHDWYEPADSFLQEAHQLHLKAITPALGKIFTATSHTDAWWKKYK